MITHGKPGNYSSGIKCRCELCTKAWAKYHLDYQRQFRAKEGIKQCNQPGCIKMNKNCSARKGMCTRHYRLYLKSK